ncbi:beta-propeller fold lactonase family protein [Microlunatus sp. Gsoil 973]|nr:beta-propeller fold lactonase family protein [Microlunatus sp. Gsoil 973]
MEQSDHHTERSTEMKLRTRVIVPALAAAALVTSGAPLASATPALHRTHHDSSGTVFVQNDDPNGNAILAYDRSRSGTLRPDGVYPTGGKGGVLGGSQIDHLASQGSLVRQGDHLYAVNAGSDTITNFKVVGDRLVKEQVINSGGDFPVSIAASRTAVYVLNARDGGSVQGYLNVAGHLIKVNAWNRQLGFDPAASPEFTSTPAQISFTPDRSRLVISTKGDGSSVETFGVGLLGALSSRPVVTPLDGRVPFGFDFDSRGHLITTEAGTNSIASFAVRHNGTIDLLDRALTGQQATCWVVVDNGVAYASNAGSATISSYRIAADGSLTPLATTATDPGTVDAAVSTDGRNLYVQTGAAGLVDEFAIGAHGSLTRIGSVAVPSGAGGEGIVAR